LQYVAAANAGSSAAANNAGLVTPYAAFTFNNSATAWQSNVSVIPTANVSLNLGSSTNWWNNFYGVATQAKYADLAENYQADKSYAPGTVLMFGGSEEVTIADQETSAVAGVVSTNPAHLMNGGLTGVAVVPLALQGRVPTNVIGPVKKGDLMVSAGHGYAKPSAHPAIGTVIGKALADFTGAKGQIEIVVGRV
jgi:ribosomal protein S28E/S33